MKFSKNRVFLKSAFTLIEILVVVSIIGLISSVAFLRIEGARARSRDAVREQQIRQIDLATRLYVQDNDRPPLTGCQAQQTYSGGRQYPTKEEASACFAVSTASVDNGPWNSFKEEISDYISSENIDDSLGYVYASPMALQYQCSLDGECEYDYNYFNDTYALYSDFESNDNSTGNISSSDADDLSSTFGYNSGNNSGSGNNQTNPQIFEVEYAVTGSSGRIEYGLDSSCLPDCVVEYGEGDSVTIEAVPDSESTFIGWSGDVCSGSNPVCDFIVEGDSSVIATFSLQYNPLPPGSEGTGSETGSGQVGGGGREGSEP
jgi:prepilin-type N-terminal cleavage/methylation domain-containing protein